MAIRKGTGLPIAGRAGILFISLTPAKDNEENRVLFLLRKSTVTHRTARNNATMDLGESRLSFELLAPSVQQHVAHYKLY